MWTLLKDLSDKFLFASDDKLIYIAYAYNKSMKKEN